MRIENYGQSAPEFWKRLETALTGRYTLRGWLGAGGFGDVFEARQESTGQTVALKVLRSFDHQGTRRRFVREMRACAALNHPHIVRILDAGGDDSEQAPLYAVFEYVSGQTLAKRLATDGALPVAQCMTLIRQILDALHAAHTAGIVHRDLTPSNIMLTETVGGIHVKVLDFGISALVEGAAATLGSQVTQTGERVGTPVYCAPEQLRGEPPTVRVDYYALGLVFLECLTGKRVFNSASLPEVLHAQFSPQPIPLPAVLENHRLGELLRWMLEKEASRRVSDARHVIDHLSRIDVRDLLDGAGYLQTAGAGAPVEAAEPATEIAAFARAQGERRPVTALCCRIELEQLLPDADEEALEEWMADLRQTITETGERHGGVLAGYAGAELVFYFGLLPSGENTTRRAALVALEIRERCARQSNVLRARGGWGLDVRLGVHYGMLTLDSGERSIEVGSGPTALAASRLCRVAGRGEIAVSSAVFHRLEGLMQMEVLPEDVRILGEPCYRLCSRGRDDIASGVIDRPLMTVTVGREAELEQLAELWQRAEPESARCVVLAGSAGIGKTHLARAWCRRVAQKGVTILECRAEPEAQGSALYPILQLLRAQLGLVDREPERSVEILKRFVNEHGFSEASAMPLLCAWLGLPATDYPELQVSPKKRRDWCLELMVSIVQELAQAEGVLLIEDIQWADPTTLEWLLQLCRSKPREHLLVLLTLRTGTLPQPHLDSAALGSKAPQAGIQALLAEPSVHAIELGPLAHNAACDLIQNLPEAAGQRPELLTPLVERAAGVPLFLLELMRCRARSRDFALPAGIAELLSVRITQLGNARETAQIASVIGTEFDYDLLRGLSQRGADLLGDISHLQSAGIVSKNPDGHYTFTHSLLRDSAYQSLPRKERQRLHKGVVRVLEQQRPELKRTKPWALALHHRHAGDLHKALEYGVAAATAALLRFDNLETLGYVEQLKGSHAGESSRPGWIADFTDPELRPQIELRLFALETTALMMTRGWADLELNQTCERARDLFTHVPLEATLQLRYALAQFYFNRGLVIDETGRDRARPYIDDLIAAADACGAQAFLGLGRMMLGAWHLFHGQVARSLEILRQVEPAADPQDAWKYGFDPHLCARSIEALSRWYESDPEVREFSEETRRMASALNHPASLAIVLLYQASLFQLLRDRDGTRRICGELLALCEHYGLQGYPGYAVILLGWADAQPVNAEAALTALAGAGQRLTAAYFGALVAEAKIESGDLAQAFEDLQRLQTLAETSGEHFYLPEILLLKVRSAPSTIPEEELDRDVSRALLLASKHEAHGMCASVAERYRKLLHAAPSDTRRARIERLLSDIDPAPTSRGLTRARELLAADL